MLGLIRQLLADRTAATAVVAAIALPAITATAGAGMDYALLEADLGHLQAAADAGATAGRQYLDPFLPVGQQAAINNAVLYANQNYASSLAAQDVVQGWWDITANTFGPPTTGQTGNLFSNAIQVTTRSNHNLVFGQLLGIPTIALSRQSVAYKCSNTDYPITLIPDDPNPPTLPAIWASFAADGNNNPSQSYYYANPDGHLNPIYKFYVPWDGIDVSFVILGSNGSQMQVDSYCKGTFLVAPDAFDISDSGQGWQPQVSYQVLRGNTNNSISWYPDQAPYPMAPEDSTTIYYAQGAQPISYFTNPQSPIRTTPYPNAQGCCQYWASDGDPTPARRAVMVQ